MTGESEGDGELVRALRGLLNSPDAAVVAGALDRLAEAGDTALMQATLGLAWVAEAPRMERSRLICCRTPGGLDEGAVHSHVASLWLMLAIREAGGALDLRPGKLCVELGSLGPEVYQARHVLGLGAHQVELECSPPLSERGAFAWAADKALARVEDAGELLRHYARGFLRRLPGLSGGLPVPLAERLLPRLLAIGGDSLSLRRWSCTALPATVDTACLRRLDIADSGITALGPLEHPQAEVDVRGAALEVPPDGVRRLRMDAAQLRRWHGGLRGVEALDVAGALTAGDAELLAGMPALRELSLRGPADGAVVAQLRHKRLRSLSLHEVSGPPPDWLWRRTDLEELGWGGALDGLPAHPPPTLHSFRIRAGRRSQLADRWRPLGGYLPLAWVRLHTVGWSRLATIRTVSNLSTLSLAEARALLEVLPCRLPVERLTVGVRESMDALDLCGCRIDVL